MKGKCLLIHRRYRSIFTKISENIEAVSNILQEELHQYNLESAGPASSLQNSLVAERRRWWNSKMQRSPSSPQIHQKYIYTWNYSYRTHTECWQKMSDLPKGKKFPTYLGSKKEKRKNRDRRIGMGPAPVGGSCEGGKDSTH